MQWNLDVSIMSRSNVTNSGSEGIVVCIRSVIEWENSVTEP